MKIILLLLPLVALPLFAACGGDDDDDSADTGSTSGTSATAPASKTESDEDSNEDSNDTASSGSDAAPEKVDVCNLLSDDDITEAANKVGLGGSATTYTITRTKQEYTKEQLEIRPKSACKFNIDSSGGSGAISIEVQEADGWGLYSSGATKIDGIGDEAVNNAGTIYVKVGDLMMTAGENSFDTTLTEELYRKAAPSLK